MTDSTHNSLVTVLIIVLVIIALALLSGRFGAGRLGYRYGYYQQASAIDAGGVQHAYDTRPTYSQTVTSYSRPSRATNFGSTTYQSDTSHTYDTVYGYECSPDGTYCWTNN